MSKKKRFGVSQALSRGLSETIHVVENNAGIFRNVILPLSRIELDPDNPRKLAISLEEVRHGIDKLTPSFQQKMAEFERLKELATTIETSGVINPIVVYKRGEVYRIVAGERRCLASILAGKNEIDARVFNEKPRGFELKLIQWVENTAREDLTLDERIGNIRDIIREYQAQSDQAVEISATLLKSITGLSLPQATYYIAVMNAPSDVKDAIQTGQIRSLDKAAIISNVASDELRQQALQACIAGCGLKELRQLITSKKSSLKKSATNHVKNKPGRVVSRVNMGFTLNTSVVKTIVESITARHEYMKYAKLFANIDWKRYEQAGNAFKKLVEILETEIS